MWGVFSLLEVVPCWQVSASRMSVEWKLRTESALCPPLGFNQQNEHLLSVYYILLLKK
jgi:hypothetical protein